MEIDLNTLPPTARERLEHHNRLQEKAARCSEFARLARTDVEAAGKYLLAMSDYEQLAAIQELEQDDVSTFVRAATSRVRERVLEIHPNPRWLKSQMVSDDAVPRYVRLQHAGHVDTDSSAYHREKLTAGDATCVIVAQLAPEDYRRRSTGYFFHTTACDISDSQAQTLRESGAGHLVRAARSISSGYTAAGERTAPEPHRYTGLSIEGSEIWPARTLAGVRTVDRELDAAIKAGTLVVSDLPLDQCRARM